MILTSTKAELRKELQLKRSSLPLSETESKSSSIVSALIKEVDWSKVKSLHSYVPISHINEVDTWQLFEYVWKNHPEIITAIPGPKDESSTISLAVNPKTRWRFGSHAPLPLQSEILKAGNKFDLIVIPLLGFDENRNRLGSGGGYYDRLLQKQPNALKVGLGYDLSQTEYDLPIQSHDIKMDWIITEDRIIR